MTEGAGKAQQDPLLTEYSRLAERYDARWSRYIEASTRETLRRFTVRPGDRVLDVGCGTGALLRELNRRHPDVHLSGVDPVAAMLDVARRRLPPSVELREGWAERLLYADRTFDVVISNSILHHIPEPRGVIEEMVRVTAPGGILFHRDLCRPSHEAEVDRLVSTYAAGATPCQQKLLADSLRAALTLEEVRTLLVEFGFSVGTVQSSSDRHWTWFASKSVGPSFYDAMNQRGLIGFMVDGPDDYRIHNRLDAIDSLTIDISRVFLGVNISCISCHNGARHLEEVNTYLAQRTRKEFFEQAAFFGTTRMIGNWNDQIKNVDRDLQVDDLWKGYDTGDDAPFTTTAESQFPRPKGVFQPAFGLVLRPEIAALTMSGSSLLVAVNALLLKRLRLPSAPSATSEG